ncbi:hypothetical protein KA012_00245 [Candidatus Woesebacteria bacterium]|nr:hypothetical protein [Candidatus Woesebacteria bacterium]
MSTHPLLVTHHSPDLDAITAVWLFKRFDAQGFAHAKVAFVNPGQTLSANEAAQFESAPHEVTHVDTGLGEFDHHQPDRGQQYLSAAKLVLEHLGTLHPELVRDAALQTLVGFVTDVDQFAEIDWPDAANPRYCLMIQELVHGLERQPDHDDLMQLEFGMRMLDAGYAVIAEQLQAQEELDTKGHVFGLQRGSGIAVETSNDATMKLAQKNGHMLVIKKDPKTGNVRIKIRPDAGFELNELRDRILQRDRVGSWYYHPSGRMLLNGSDKHRDQKASPLTLEQVTKLVKELYG